LFIIGSAGNLRRGLLVGGFAALASVLGALYLYLRANAYYSRRFGYVETMGATERSRSRISAYLLDGPPLRSIAVGSLGLMLLFVPFGIAAAIFHSIWCTLWGSRLLASWAHKRCPASQAYYPVLVLLLLVFARWSGGPINDRSLFDTANDIACGIMLVVVGLLDHWQLVRSMKPLDEAELSALDEESR
jgi:hypothetical protein